VDTGNVMGNVYDIEIVFMGADHLVQSKNFRDSATKKGYWTVSHPYYGIIICHPAALKYNNEEGNITRINGQILETIDGGQLGSDVNAFDKISIDKLDVDNKLFTTYIANVPAPSIKSVQAMAGNIGKINSSVSPLTTLSTDYTKFRNYVNAANNYIATATDFPGEAMASIEQVIAAPAAFITNVVTKFDMLESALVGLYNFVNYGIGAEIKSLYENNAGCIIGSMCLASVSNITSDYATMPAAISVIGRLVNNYNSYLANLEQLQTPTGSEVNAYMPDMDSMSAIYDLVQYTVGQLLVIAASAKQQRIFVLPEDDNVHTLTFALYGTSADDIVDQLISDNDINYRELLLIKKGREIIYYV